VYKQVGCTAGYEPSGGGFSEYVRVMDWIVARGGVVKLPPDVSFEQASFIEPINTCLKGIQTLALAPGETVLVMGQGPIGILLGVLAQRAGAKVFTSDLFPQRLTIAAGFGLNRSMDASRSDAVQAVRQWTEGRVADAVVLAVAGTSLIPAAVEAARPGGRILLFAQTVRGEAVIDPAAICVDEKTLLGSYSASVDLQDEAVSFVCRREMDLERLITHRFPLSSALEALNLAAHPRPDSMKVVIQPALEPKVPTA
ncbi:MAG: zinc-binding dehydrogenase, partial [Terriglobales bacterium]